MCTLRSSNDNINNINARLDVKSLQQLHHQDAGDYFENHE